MNARDLKVTSIQVVEVSRVASGNADDARDRGAVTADQVARGDEAVAVGDMLDDGVNGVLGAVSTAPKNWVFAALGEANSGGHTQEWTCLFAFRVLATSSS
ncbi:hypothetical protein [Deinococcus sp. JMULE3]|uniref:hypothetical protein n=1 Tax=Deinococcus sp. JMULE3 TaxID=2518341 RepID=UPI001576D232|nr:hypothetical protein [Deinococcus sp. JMULE3]